MGAGLIYGASLLGVGAQGVGETPGSYIYNTGEYAVNIINTM